MSATPTSNIVRLQELKLWQGSYDNLLQKSRYSSQEMFCSSLDDAGDWDKRQISPAKPFEELLEEKLAEETPVLVSDRPKRPFLKKGQGLARFGMGASYEKCLRSSGRGNSDKTNDYNTPKPKGILKSRTPLRYDKVDFSPLTVPDFVKQRASWKDFLEKSEPTQTNRCRSASETTEGSVENYDEFRNSLGSQKGDHDSSVTSFNEGILQKVEEFKKLSRIKGRDGGFVEFIHNDVPDNIEITTKAMGEHTLDEVKQKEELRIFEMLERKVDNNSFCSTNTSIRNLLASTPRKANFSNGRIDKKGTPGNTTIETNIEQKLQQVSEKANVLQRFLLTLKNLDPINGTHSTVDSDVKTLTSTNTSFSEGTTHYSSASLTENFPEFETLDQNTKIDAGVNTSMDLEVDTTMEPCKECHELRSKCADFQSKLSSHSRRIKELEKDNNELKKSLKHEKEKVEDLREEVDNERRRFNKERLFFENYVKDAQNRPTKREREEMTQLKQELADAKELIKLKDTKSGATQARLRTQLKQHEKELMELKTLVEKLQKDNAKLTASQKYARRPQEVKMLQEINKNITKLAEETLKKQSNGDGDSLRSRCQSESAIKNCDKENSDKTRRSYGEKVDTPDISIEQQYEQTFGHFDSPLRNNNSSTVDKTEKLLADGSMQTTYGNGNVKTVSNDGNLTKIVYFNGDVKETDLNAHVVKYYYAAAESVHTQYSDGMEVMQYKDGQKCTKFPDGKTEVLYPDGSLRIINRDGSEEHRFPDGRTCVKNVQGDQIILLPNGEREVHTDEYKRREYPDGTIRTLHKDGTVETVYANGRVRLRDANGVLILDTHEKEL